MLPIGTNEINEHQKIINLFLGAHLLFSPRKTCPAHETIQPVFPGASSLEKNYIEGAPFSKILRRRSHSKILLKVRRRKIFQNRAYSAYERAKILFCFKSLKRKGMACQETEREKGACKGGETISHNTGAIT